MYVHLYRFLSTKAARGALRRAGQVFPGAQQVTLCHANGWCDPVQARMDVEPLVRLESRLVSLEPLALGLPQLTRLAIHDATFTRDPWPLSQLLWLPGLKGLEVAWGTGLWAPGQVLQEAEALQVSGTAAGDKDGNISHSAVHLRLKADRNAVLCTHMCLCLLCVWQCVNVVHGRGAPRP